MANEQPLRAYLTPIKVGTLLRDVMGWTSQSLSALERRRWSDLERPFWESEAR